MTDKTPTMTEDMEVIIRAAEEGLRNAESDAKDGVEGADEAVDEYEAALNRTERIFKAIKGG